MSRQLENTSRVIKRAGRLPLSNTGVTGPHAADAPARKMSILWRVDFCFHDIEPPFHVAVQMLESACVLDNLKEIWSPAPVSRCLCRLMY